MLRTADAGSLVLATAPETASPFSCCFKEANGELAGDAVAGCAGAPLFRFGEGVLFDASFAVASPRLPCGPAFSVGSFERVSIPAADGNLKFLGPCLIREMKRKSGEDLSCYSSFLTA